MTYEETLQYLYESTPVFQHEGAGAYKPGLDTSRALDDLLGNPHRAYRTIHVGGTNGKGSTSHLLAAILQKSGYKVGLYTSPHLVDFRERIRVNGEKIDKEYVVQFVEQYREQFEPLKPSFFELTSTMALAYFRDQQVDFAVIEVGLGGRLDSTNIITPVLSVITNISLDHTQFLGDTLEAIAGEKAGIIKAGIPVVIGEAEHEGVREVFVEKAREVDAPLYIAPESILAIDGSLGTDNQWHYTTEEFGNFIGELGGMVQSMNTITVLASVKVLRKAGIEIPDEAIHEAFAHVVELTGLMGRWQTLCQYPRVVCDTGHNPGGWEYLSWQLEAEARRCNTLRMIIGISNDKDIDGVLDLMPQEATYYFTQASVSRALPAQELRKRASKHGLMGKYYASVAEAVETVLQEAAPDDFIFIGGSTFVVADAMPLFNEE